MAIIENFSVSPHHKIQRTKLFEGNWAHSFNGCAAVCRLVIDASDPRIVAAQRSSGSFYANLSPSELSDLEEDVIGKAKVHLNPSAWGFCERAMVPSWTLIEFSDAQIEELERMQLLLESADEGAIEGLLQARSDFFQSQGMTDDDAIKALSRGAAGGRRLRRHRSVQ